MTSGKKWRPERIVWSVVNKRALMIEKNNETANTSYKAPANHCLDFGASGMLYNSR